MEPTTKCACEDKGCVIRCRHCNHACRLHTSEKRICAAIDCAQGACPGFSPKKSIVESTEELEASTVNDLIRRREAVRESLRTTKNAQEKKPLEKELRDLNQKIKTDLKKLNFLHGGRVPGILMPEPKIDVTAETVEQRDILAELITEELDLSELAEEELNELCHKIMQEHGRLLAERRKISKKSLLSKQLYEQAISVIQKMPIVKKAIRLRKAEREKENTQKALASLKQPVIITGPSDTKGFLNAAWQILDALISSKRVRLSDEEMKVAYVIRDHLMGDNHRLWPDCEKNLESESKKKNHSQQ